VPTSDYTVFFLYNHEKMHIMQKAILVPNITIFHNFFLKYITELIERKFKALSAEADSLKHSRLEVGLGPNRKVVIAGTLRDILHLYILQDHFICNIAGGCSKITACPQMTTPKLFG